MTSIKDYTDFIVLPDRIKDPLLKGATVKMLPNGLFPWRETGGFCVVFHLTAKTGRQYAVRCWHSDIDLAQNRCREISKKIHDAKLPYFVHFDYVDKALLVSDGLVPFVRMEWVDALDLKAYIIANKATPGKIRKLAENFAKMCRDLHRKKISHGDLHHDNIMVKENGDIILLDYDSIYHPSMGKVTALVQGKRDYQHPSRKNAPYASVNIDAFSELIIYTSLLYLAEKPSAINDHFKATDYLVFSESDFANFRTTNIFKELSSLSDTMRFWVESIAKSLDIVSLDALPNLEQVLISKQHVSWQAHTKLWLLDQQKSPSMNRAAFIISCVVAYLLFLGALKSVQHFFTIEESMLRISNLAIQLIFSFSMACIVTARLRNIGLLLQYKYYAAGFLLYLIFYLVLTMVDTGIGLTPIITTLVILGLICVLIPSRCIALIR